MAAHSFASSPALRGHWYAVARASELHDRPQAVTLLGEALVLWRGADGRPAAARDRCPHREAPLSEGWCEQGKLVCPYHGWTYDQAGACVLVPSSGAGGPIPPKARLATVHATERYGLVWLCPGEPVAGIPEIVEEDDDAYRRINLPVEPWAVSAPRMTDNFLDYSHFPYVHRGTFGGATAPDVGRIELQDLGGFHGYRYGVEVANPAAARTTSGQAAATVTRVMTTGFALPFAVRSTIDYETGLRHVLLLLTTPVDDLRSLFTFVVWRNDDFSTPADEIVAFDRAIGAEDKVMLEKVPGLLPLDATGVCNVQSDRASVEWKRRFRDLVGG